MRIKKILGYLMFVSAVIIIIQNIGRILVLEQFAVPTASMTPTLLPGDKILVNKFECNLKYLRLFKWGRIASGDVIVFHAPLGNEGNKIERNPNLIYCKRCIGAPGDTIVVFNGFFCNKRNIRDRNSENLPDHVKFTRIQRKQIDSSQVYLKNVLDAGTFFRVPARGDSIELNGRNNKLYIRIIEYEQGVDTIVSGDSLLIKNRGLKKYTFEQSYYIACGDNVLNSIDSRYWGVIPEEFLIGTATRVLTSLDPLTNIKRENRFLKRIY